MPSGIGYGAAEGMEKVLARLFLEQRERQRIAEQQQQFGLQERRLTEDTRQFDTTAAHNDRVLQHRVDEDLFQRPITQGNLRMREQEFAQGQQEHTDDQNYRAANLAMQGTTMANQNNQSDLNRQSAERIAGIRQSGSATGMGDTQDLQKLAEMVITQPELLDKMAPTQRGAVLAAIANDGGRLTGQKEKLLGTVLDESITAIQEAINHKGRTSGAGAPSLMDPGSLPRAIGMNPMAGSNAAGFGEQLKRVQSLITAPRLDLMRGLGPMSEREFAAMQASGSKLSTNLGDDELLAELNRLLTAAQAARKGVRPAQQAAAPAQAAPAVGGVDVDALRKQYGY